MTRKPDRQPYRIEVKLLPPTATRSSWFSLWFFLCRRDSAYRRAVYRCRSGQVPAALGKFQSPVGRALSPLAPCLEAPNHHSSRLGAPFRPNSYKPLGAMLSVICVCVFHVCYPTLPKLSAFLRQGYGWAALFLGILSVANFSAWPTSYEAIRWFHRLPLVNALSPARPILLWIELALPFGLYLGRCPQTPEQTRCLRPLLSARRQELFRYRTQSILRFNGLIPTYSPPWFLGTTSWACLV
jgi:sigma-B regulation protein RsbU (phosphoserine phosphatase)